ncbi:MAG: hypothetical protein MI867_29815 [Pseudomonadales bacterium]|nr:hypothetical protein [Pseudomonadales bacterium]
MITSTMLTTVQRAVLLLTMILLSHWHSKAMASDFYQLTSPCNPISLNTCALPYPTDAYGLEDVNSPTGLTLEYPVGAVREELLDEVPPSLTPQTVFNGSSGYSAASSVLFELSDAADPATLPSDGGNSVIAFNLNTGERIPLRVQINEFARSDKVSAPSEIVEIYPRSRWQFGERYAVFLTKKLKPLNDDTFAISPGFTQAISGDNSEISNYYEPTIQFFEAQGFDRNELLSATFFTVRDEWEATGRLIELSESVYSKPHPIRNLKIHYKIFGHIGAFVTGEVLAYNFRDEYGGMIYDTNAAEDNWLQFRLTLPRVAKKGPVPISIYGHGLSAFKETDLMIAIGNAKMGIATISIDHPNHGSRIRADGGYVMSRLDTPYVPLMVGMIAQSSVDHISLLKAIKTSIGSLDILPKRFWNPLFTRRLNNGDGVPDIDIDNIFYQGTSLGGVLGSAFVSIAPDLKGAFFQVTGVGITNILANSALWDSSFSKLEPDEADGAEAMVLKAAMQHELDYGDAINFVHYLRDPIPFGKAKPVVVMAGEGDQIVPNFSTVAFAEIVNLPMANEPLFDMPGIENLGDYDEGYGVLHFPSLAKTTSDELNGLAAHGSFLWASASKAMHDWIKRYMLSE